MSEQLLRDLELIGRWCSVTGARYELANSHGTWFAQMTPNIGYAPCGYGDICQAVHETANDVVKQAMRLQDTIPSVIGDWKDESDQ
jgi:hypothetical protein